MGKEVPPAFRSLTPPRMPARRPRLALLLLHRRQQKTRDDVAADVGVGEAADVVVPVLTVPSVPMDAGVVSPPARAGHVDLDAAVRVFVPASVGSPRPGKLPHAEEDVISAPISPASTAATPVEV